MKVLLIGASGAIGGRLVPQLIDHGHDVIGTCHSPAKTRRLRALGAEPVVLEALWRTRTADPLLTIALAIHFARPSGG
jgi:uncharacterized protein YbjT (DUF2867 family)